MGTACVANALRCGRAHCYLLVLFFSAEGCHFVVRSRPLLQRRKFMNSALKLRSPRIPVAESSETDALSQFLGALVR
jgi:hypothetical protein